MADLITALTRISIAEGLTGFTEADSMAEGFMEAGSMVEAGDFMVAAVGDSMVAEGTEDTDKG